MRIKKFANNVFECESKVMFALLLLYILGLVYGCFSGTVLNLLNDFRFTSILSDNLFTLFSKNILVVLIIFLLGYSVIGTPFICFIIYYCGVSNGVFCTYYSCNFGLKGSFIVVLLFYFYYLIIFLTIALMSYSSIRLSLSMFSYFRSETRYVSPRIYSGSHVIKFFIFSIFTFLISAYYIAFANRLSTLFL